MTTKKYIELLAENEELRKAQYARLGDLNAAIRIMKRFHVPSCNPEYLKLQDKQRKIKSMMEWCERLMSEQEYYDLAEGDDEGNAMWMQWWCDLKEIEL